MSTEVDLKAYIHFGDSGLKPACPTHHRILTDKFIALTCLEDEAPHLNLGKAEGSNSVFGELSRETQLQVIEQPDFPADERENVLAHWELWDKYHYNDSDGKSHGVMLVSGGKASVDKFADDWLKRHPKAAKKAKQSPHKKKKSGANKLKLFMVAPQLKPEFFPDWTPGELATLDAASAGDAEPMGHAILERLEAAGMAVKAAYAIAHTRDIYTVQNYIDAGGDPDHYPGNMKEPHIHFIANAGTDRTAGLTISAIAKAIGYIPRTENAEATDEALAEAQIEKAKDKNSWGNWLAYLIHAKDPDKAQYAPREVATLKGAPYGVIAEANAAQWAIGAVEKTKDALREKLDWLIQECAQGRIMLDDILQLDEAGRPGQLYAIYTQSAAAQREVKAALAAGKELRLATSRAALMNREFERTNLYIYGEAGTGKTMLAKTLESGLEHVFPLIDEPHHWRSQRLASRNPLDDYDGREVVTINEFRSSTFGEMQAFLQFTDPHDCDPFGNRYHNTAAGAQRVTVFTTPTPPTNLFFFMPKAGSGNARCDSIDQALRRFAFVIEVLDPREHHDYKYRLYRPTKRPTPYAVEIEIDEFDSEYMDLTIYLEPFDALLGADGLLEILVRDLDTRANGGRLAASGLMDEAIRYFQNEFRHVIEGAVANEGFPSLPPIEVKAKEVKNDDEETSGADA